MRLAIAALAVGVGLWLRSREDVAVPYSLGLGVAGILTASSIVLNSGYGWVVLKPGWLPVGLFCSFIPIVVKSGRAERLLRIQADFDFYVGER